MDYQPTFFETLKKSIIVCFGAGVLAALVNLAIYFFANSMGFWQMGLDADPNTVGVQTIEMKHVLAGSVLPGLVSGLLFALLYHFTSKAHFIFWAIAGAIFLFFMYPPTQVPGIENGMKWVLEMLHVPPAAFILAAVNRYFVRK